MKGRPKKSAEEFEDVYLEVKAGKLTPSQGARKLGVSRATRYRREKEYKDNPPIDF